LPEEGQIDERKCRNKFLAEPDYLKKSFRKDLKRQFYDVNGDPVVYPRL